MVDNLNTTKEKRTFYSSGMNDSLINHSFRMNDFVSKYSFGMNKISKTMRILHIAECAGGVDRYLSMLLPILENHGLTQYFNSEKERRAV